MAAWAAMRPSSAVGLGISTSESMTALGSNFLLSASEISRSSFSTSSTTRFTAKTLMLPSSLLKREASSSLLRKTLREAAT